MGHAGRKSSDGNDHNADGHRHPGRDATPHYQGGGVELTQSGLDQANKEHTKTGEPSPLVTRQSWYSIRSPWRVMTTR